MKLIQPTPKLVEKDRFQKYIDQLKQMLPIGKTGEQAEEAIIARFLRGLDNRFVMIRNFQLEGMEYPFPAILVGPFGLALLNISREKGIFRAREDSWWKMDKNTRRFNPAHPNLLRQTQEFARQLATILDEQGKPHPEIAPILLFANPGVHIESTNPIIRIILIDGVENLITTLLKSPPVLEPDEINFLSESLELILHPEKAIPLGTGEDIFGRDLFIEEKKPGLKLPTINLSTKMPLPPVEEKLKFTRQQWIILAVLLLLTIVVLLVAIVFALSSI